MFAGESQQDHHRAHVIHFAARTSARMRCSRRMTEIIVGGWSTSRGWLWPLPVVARDAPDHRPGWGRLHHVPASAARNVPRHRCRPQTHCRHHRTCRMRLVRRSAWEDHGCRSDVHEDEELILQLQLLQSNVHLLGVEVLGADILVCFEPSTQVRPPLTSRGSGTGLPSYLRCGPVTPGRPFLLVPARPLNLDRRRSGSQGHKGLISSAAR